MSVHQLVHNGSGDALCRQASTGITLAAVQMLAAIQIQISAPSNTS